MKRVSKKTKTIRIVVERSIDSFGSYAENVWGINGCGYSIDDAKNSALESIEIIKGFNDKNIPAALKRDYDIVFKFDTESFLNFYRNTFTSTALERMTGIPKNQFNQYASGLKKPRPAQVKKIQNAMRDLGKELVSVKF